MSSETRGGSRAAAKMERFVIMVNGFQPLTVITKRSILDVAAALDPPLETVGIQERIMEMSKKEVYTHCCGNNLSLVVISGCKIPLIQNVLDIVEEVSPMFVKV